MASAVKALKRWWAIVQGRIKPPKRTAKQAQAAARAQKNVYPLW